MSNAEYLYRAWNWLNNNRTWNWMNKTGDKLYKVVTPKIDDMLHRISYMYPDLQAPKERPMPVNTPSIHGPPTEPPAKNKGFYHPVHNSDLVRNYHFQTNI
jgi:hypothetical protein